MIWQFNPSVCLKILTPWLEVKMRSFPRPAQPAHGCSMSVVSLAPEDLCPPRMTVSVSAGHCGGVSMPDRSSDASVFAIAGFPPLHLSSLKGSRPHHTSNKKPCIKYLPSNEICMLFCTDQKTKHQRFDLLNIISVKG